MRKLFPFLPVPASISKAVVLSALSGVALLSGCAVGNLATESTPLAPVSGIEISGTVHGGATAISGATVSLYVSGTSGYGQGATLIGQSAAPTAISTGAFTITPTFSTTSCTSPGQIVYVTVSGGDPTGNTLTANNHAILMADVLGVCSSINSSIKLSINEATTVAAAYALRGFTKVTSAAGGLASLNIGTPSTNTQGLSDAAANTLLLVNPNTGYPNPSTATVLLPQNMVNSLANSTTACVNSTEYNVGNCSTFLSLATPPSGSAPSNIYQALLNIAAYPGQNVASLLNLGTGFSLFQPTVSTTTATTTVAPNDLSLGIAYLNSTQATAAGNSAVGLTIDNSDNVWVIGASSGTSTSTYNYLSELTSSSAGPAYSNTLGSTQPLDGTHTLRNARFDTAGNLWLTDKNATAGGVIQVPKSGSSVNIAGATEYTFGIAALDQNDYDLAVDATGNVFTASYGAQGNCTLATSGTTCNYVEFQKSGSYAATNLFGGSAQPSASVRGMAADTVSSSAGFGNIWAANYGVFGASTAGNSVQFLKPSTGALTTVTLGSAADSPFGVALDASGNAYVTAVATQATSALYYVPQTTGGGGTTGTGSTAPTVNASITSSVPVTGNAGALANIPNATSSPASSATTPLAIGGLNGEGYDAVDGAGNVFISNYNYGSIVEYSPTLSGYVSPYYGFSPSLQIPASTITVTAITLASAGTANIYYTGGTVTNGQQVTFSGFTGSYAFLNGNTYTVSNTSFAYFVIPDGGQTAISKTTTTGTATFAASNQVVFQCGPYATTTTSTTCTTVGNGTARNNAIGIDRAGTVWTLGTNGTLVGLIGTAAPTNPVLAAGQAGQLP